MMSQSLPAPAPRPIALEHFELAEAQRDLDPDAFAASAPVWHPAVVPGGVHESLIAAGVIEDPNFDRNEDSIRWMEERDWWYRARFAAPTDLQDGERHRLVFHGLDTVVAIWLNGTELGRHENMFRPAEFDVTDLLTGENEVLLRFSPPLAGLTIPPAVADMNRRLHSLITTGRRDSFDPDDLDAPVPVPPGMSPLLSLSTSRRKATFSWGWDFGPRVPSIGVWRPVELVRETAATIVGHHVGVTDLPDGRNGAAELALLVETRGAVAGLTARVTLTSPSGVTTVHELPFDGDTARASVTLEAPELWWTHDLGRPDLYDVLIETLQEGAVLTSIEDRIGLRTVEIDRERADDGWRRFRFVLNGVPLFARGACLVPASMLVGSVSSERHRQIVSLAREGNMNMIRIWGGGVYELDAFYAATDELGVLVWQDFMFACTDYPSFDPAFQREVESEARYQVRRLRNRASIGLWCGNNEVQMIHGFAYGDYETGEWGRELFDRILPEVVDREDGLVPYWPGSPWGEGTPEGFAAVNGVLDGDRHAWEVWHGGDVGAGGGPYDSVGEARHHRRYANDRGRFISEFGIHASPDLATLERWIPKDELRIHSASFDAHNKDEPKDKHDAVLEIVTGLPTTIEEYVQYTMVSQGEGLKFGIEHYRRRQPLCSGTLIWQLNDAWPGFSWSVIDFDLVPKAGYYFASRAFEPVLASFEPVDDGAELWVSNSTEHDLETTARVSRVGMDGRTRTTEDVAVHLEAGGSRAYWSGPLDADEILWVESTDGRFAGNRAFAGDVKDLRFGEHSLSHTTTATGPTTAAIAIVSSGYNYLTHVTSPYVGPHYSENYLDLRDGETITVSITGLPEGFDPARLVVAGFIGAKEQADV